MYKCHELELMLMDPIKLLIKIVIDTVDPRLSGPRLSSTSIILHHFRVNLLIDFARGVRIIEGLL